MLCPLALSPPTTVLHGNGFEIPILTIPVTNTIITKTTYKNIFSRVLAGRARPGSVLAPCLLWLHSNARTRIAVLSFEVQVNAMNSIDIIK